MNLEDLVLCTSKICPIKEICLRHTAKQQKTWQSFADFSEHMQKTDGGYKCYSFIYNDKDYTVHADG